MRSIVHYFLTHPRITNMIVILILVAGIFSTATINRQMTPNISFDIIKITTLYPGAGPRDVEINVTSPIEDELSEVENIRRMTSMSMENMSIIYCEVDPDAGNPVKTKRNIHDAVERVTDLPSDLPGKPLVEELQTSNMPVIEIAVHGNVSEKELRNYARDLEARLKEVPGVGSLSKIGFRDREVRIQVDIEKMKENEITFHEIINAIRTRNVRTSGGTIDSYTSEKKIVTLAEYEDPMDVKDVIIRSNFSNYQLRLDQVAELQDSFEEPRILFRGMGTDAIGISVTAQEHADIIDLSDELKEKLDEFQQGLPEGVKAELIFDYSIYTSIILDLVRTNGMLGFILVFFVMFIFLDIRSAFWCAFGIPVTVLGALMLFPVFNLTMNNLTLGVMILLLGIMVDDAIVVTEKVYTLKQEGQPAGEATLNGTMTMMSPITAAILTTILGFLPIIFIEGVFGKFLGSIPVVVILVLGFSWFESMFILPSHVHHAKPPAKTPRRSRWLEPVLAWYERTLQAALKRRGRVTLVYILSLALILGLSAAFLKFMLNEERDPDFFAVVIEAPKGTSLERTGDMVVHVEKVIQESIPEETLKSFTTQVGHHDLNIMGSTAGQYTNWALITVYLIPAAQRTVTSEEIQARISSRLEDVKKKHGFTRLDLQELGGIDAGKPVHVIYTSGDDSVRKQFEQETLDFLKGVNGVHNIETDNVPGKPELRLKLDYSRLASMGLTAYDVGNTVRTAFEGTVVTSIRRHGEDIDFRVQIANPERFRDQSLLELPVANREGRLVKLRHFAGLEERPSPSVVHHHDGRRSVSVTADLDTDVVTSVEVNRMLRERFEKEAAAIPDLRMKLAGQEEETARSLQGFLFALVVAVLTIYFLLVVLFNSFIQPFLIMSIVPFAVGGVFLTLLFHNMPVTMIALMGLLGLIGVAINDTIVIISHLNRTCREKGFDFSTIAEGARDRFRPVILTTLTTFAGLLPTAYGIGGDLPDLRPMVVTMAWGLVFATLVTLGLIPLLYSLVTLPPRPWKKKQP
jgi:multidrug efflux pump subunit AcrB